MIFHLALNSLFVFLMMVLAVEAILVVFKVNHPRLRMICRSIPLFKLPLDLLFFALIQENGFANFNPCSCEIYFHEFLSIHFPEIFKIALSTHPVIIPTYIASVIPSSWMAGVVGLICVGAFGLFFWRLGTLLSSFLCLKEILRKATPYPYSVHNLKLASQLQASLVKVRVTDQIAIPCAVYPNTILFPTLLLQHLQTEEREAILAHELEHLQWNDPLFKALQTLICAFFWWIPTLKWRNKIYADQEEASDYAVLKYEIPKESLAAALIKVAKITRKPFPASGLTCSLSNAESPTFQRIARLLVPTVPCGSLKLSVVFTLCIAAYLLIWAC